MKYEIILDNSLDEDSFYFQEKLLEREHQEVNYKEDNTKEKKDKKKEEKKKLDRKIQNYKRKVKKKKIELSYIKKITGIFDNDEDFESYIESLMLGSFGMRSKFILESPYFSRDDDELYFVQNPILKEYTTKIPMIRGSGWKGYLSSSALEILGDMVKDESSSIIEIIKFYLSYIRIFGTGSDNFRKIKLEIEDVIEKNSKNKKDIESLVEYCLYDLGIGIKITKNGTSIFEQLISKIFENEGKAKNIFSVSKGRGIFYPTYFDNMKYEVINPQDREKRAGKSPIFYEVVPKGTEGAFQFVYIPFNGILTDSCRLEEEIKADKDFMETVFKYCLEGKGIGAKNKLGWGICKVNGKIKFFDSKVEA